MKDFKGDEFKEHTKCISEEEKYSAKGFVAKPNKNKGAQKQESWTETLQNLINKPGLDPQIKRIVEKVAAQTNVPRKKPKFINFVKNSMKISLDNANKVWDVVEEALGEFKQIAEANRQKKEAEKKTANGDAEPSETAENGKKIKKKKKKTEAKMETDDDAETNGHSIENGKSRKRAMDTSSTDDGGAKKKKKKNKSNGTNDSESAAANGNLGNEEEQNSIIAGDGKFDWQSTIVDILSKKTAPMAIDKLKGKVVKKYATQTSNDVSAGVEKKFLKKLKATPNVTITNELVKLVK